MKSPKELAKITKENKARIDKEIEVNTKKKALEAKKKHDALLKEAEKLYFKWIEDGIESAAKYGHDHYNFYPSNIDYKYYHLLDELIPSIKKHFKIYKPVDSCVYKEEENYETGNTWTSRVNTIYFSWRDE